MDRKQTMQTGNKKILVIEDEKSLRGALVDFLTIKNYRTFEAKNGKEGVRIALKEHPDLILLDLIMPEMDGVTTLKMIRKDTWGANVPIIILTNLTTPNERFIFDALTNKSTFYLIKSDWKLHDIVKKVEEILEG